MVFHDVGRVGFGEGETGALGIVQAIIAPAPSFVKVTRLGALQTPCGEHGGDATAIKLFAFTHGASGEGFDGKEKEKEY